MRPPQEGTEPFSARDLYTSRSMNLKFRVKVEQEEDGFCYADCLDFQGCHTFGERHPETGRTPAVGHETPSVETDMSTHFGD